jgi:hypothetical protein
MILLCCATVISKKKDLQVVCNQSIMAWMVLAHEPTLSTPLLPQWNFTSLAKGFKCDFRRPA